MANYYTPPRDWSVRTPSFLRRPTRDKFCDRTLQQGVTIFSRKKKNGSKLWSQRQLIQAAENSKNKVPLTTVAVAFPKMPL